MYFNTKCKMLVRKKYVVGLVFLIVAFYTISRYFRLYYDVISSSTTMRSLQNRIPIHVAVVACGQKKDETLAMIKSAILFNNDKTLLRFLLFVEGKNLAEGLEEKLSDWKMQIPFFDYELLPLKFPAQNVSEWRNLFKPCAAQRLFLPSILDSVDALLYVDTDILFMSPVSDVWNFFTRFNKTQIAALAPEHEDQSIGWYNRFARHPYYGNLGLNSGVMLMNLTRMRQFQWESHVLPIYKKYKLFITWGDQDIINILFYYHPDKLYLLPCEYNFRPDHCMYVRTCNSVNLIKIVHGNRGFFHSSKQPIFALLYDVVQRYQVGTDVCENFIGTLKAELRDPYTDGTNCGKISNSFLKITDVIPCYNSTYDIG